MQGRATTLHRRMLWRNIDAEHERNPVHTFIADQRHFQFGVTINWTNLWNEAVGGEINVTDTIIRLADYIVEHQVD